VIDRGWIPEELFEQIKKVMPIFGAAVVVLNGNDVLLIKRAGGHLRGLWSLPAGRLNIREMPEECGRREVKEETGLVLSQLTELGLTTYMDNEIHTVGISYASEADTREVNLNEEHSEYMWVPFDRLPDNLAPTIKKVIGEAVSKMRFKYEI